jgi:hypothetical protein
VHNGKVAPRWATSADPNATALCRVLLRQMRCQDSILCSAIAVSGPFVSRTGRLVPSARSRLDAHLSSALQQLQLCFRSPRFQYMGQASCASDAGASCAAANSKLLCLRCLIWRCPPFSRRWTRALHLLSRWVCERAEGVKVFNLTCGLRGLRLVSLYSINGQAPQVEHCF